ncbi:ankyrin repeat-containing protein [Acanthamoeba castellanii str. Neff]|uniref:Ankyrin repeat-containing protein n=1 Tax=Acanthamoeba castellanii (strain ATCC 30010 / Neff) TaxID=1257118 RepID=L8H7C1_ACACF|nr:ankyrin repeat-containing protein [Acanthamoeba castellanii str. Neff]ELR20386.1 ankyrin repeat-containing protein [Acanthamoeba castellanii str. Neff]
MNADEYLDYISNRSVCMILTHHNSGNYALNEDERGAVAAASEGRLEDLHRYDKGVVRCGGDMPLRMAAKGGHLAYVRYLLEECGADIHAESDRHDSITLALTKDAIISSAAHRNDIEMLDYLLSRHPERLCTDHAARNITSDIMNAISDGHVEVVGRLLAHGEKAPKKAVRYLRWYTPEESVIPILELFLFGECAQSLSSEEWSDLLSTAALNHKLERAKWIAARCPRDRQLDYDEALYSATYSNHEYGDYPMIVWLLDQGARFDQIKIKDGLQVLPNMNGEVHVAHAAPVRRYLSRK